MPSNDIQSQINLLDSAYQKLSGFKFRLNGVVTGREQAWAAFINAGFTLRDLDAVICWLNRRIKEGKRDIGSKRFSTLIGCIDRFNEELAMAQAESRQVRVTTAKDRVLSQARPTVSEPPTTNTARPISEYIEALRKAANESAR